MPTILGLSPKHTIYAFVIYSQICAIFGMRKERKEAGLGPFFKNATDKKLSPRVVIQQFVQMIFNVNVK